MPELTQTEVKILEALAEYRYLTTDQMRRVGVSSNVSHIREALRRLAKLKKAPIRQIKHDPIAGIGRFPHVSTLREPGAQIVADWRGVDLASVQYPKTSHKPTRDFLHRIECVEFRVLLDRWLESPHVLEQYDAYYDHFGSNRGKVGVRLQAATTIRDVQRDEQATPDAMCVLKTRMPNGETVRRLVIYEHSRGIETKRVVEQLMLHCRFAKDQRHINKYGIKYKPRICWTFNTENGLKAVQNRLMSMHSEYLEKMEQAIFFKTLTEVGDSFNNGWQSINPEKPRRALFPD